MPSGNLISIASKSFLMLLLFAACSNITEEAIDDPGTASLTDFEGIAVYPTKWIVSENVMAYALNEDDAIYVADKYVPEIQEALNATITDGIWEYTSADGSLLKRKQKPLQKDIDLSGGVSIVKWAYAKGYQCQEREAGFLLPIHKVEDNERKTVAVYRTKEKGHWCIDNKYDRCKFFWKEVKDRFIKVRNGKLQKNNGKYVLTDSVTARIMICITE